MSVNRVVLIGRLTRDPELRTTNSGKNVVDFSIAVQMRIKPQDGGPDADFFRIQAWGQTADYVSNYIGKGRLVAVDGRLNTRKWTDSNGQSRETIEIVADNVNGLDRPRDDNDQSGGSSRPASNNSRPASRPAKSSTEDDEYDPFADE